MGGTTGDSTKSSTVSGGTLASNPNTFAGSRSAAASTPEASDFSSWLSSVPGWANNAATTNPMSTSNPLLSNPTAAATPANVAPPAEFNHIGYQPTADIPHIGAPDRAILPAAAASTTPAEDPNARVAVYVPGGGFGFGTPSGTFGSTTQNTYQQHMVNGQMQEASNPYGITVGGVDSGNDSWQARGARELSWLDPASYQQNTTLQQSGIKPTAMSYKPGDVVPTGTNNVPTMSKALYDFNMKAYGNPYGAGYTQQYIGGPTPTPVYPGDHQ